MIKKINFISASAGSGKTYELTEKLYELLSSGKIDSSRVIATTFTRKSAAELRNRVRQKLLTKGASTLACQIENSLIGTVNSVCGQLLGRFSFEAGLSPDLVVIDEIEGSDLFNQAMEMNLPLDRMSEMNRLEQKLGQDDWRNKVKSIVELTRSNNIATDDLSVMGRESLQSLMAYFPDATTRDLSTMLYDKIQDSIPKFDGTQKNTKNYVTLIKNALSKLKANRLPWSEWVKITKTKPAVAFQQFSDEISQIAMDYDQHPDLHADIKGYCEGLFAIASESLHCFQTYKAQRGLIDFVDQEHLLLKLLGNEAVRSRISAEMDLLMVDEFQDTSPLQLALFLKLAGCAKQVYFVGDIKQSIYGFRGSDPSLMFAVINEIEKHGGDIQVLKNSYRSCENLVNYTNAIFTQTFSNTLKPELVSLVAKRTNIKNENVVEHWQLQGRNKVIRANALAGAIKASIQSKKVIFDHEVGHFRSIKLSDIAILTRSNEHVDEIAAVLVAHNLPVQKIQVNLIKTAEASLVLACIRRLIDENDTLASAEIISLSESAEPEIWLQDRLSYLNENNVSAQWGESQNILLSQLKEMRNSIHLYTPSEIVQHIVIGFNIRSIVNQWGSDQQQSLQRLNNLDTLMASVKEYENRCLMSGNVATLSDLLLCWHKQSVEKTDVQAMLKDQDAVNIMTYHKAKGLEWPVVILEDLNKSVKTRVWLPHIINSQSRLDINAPLVGRKIRYWSWPFGKQAAGIHVKEVIENSQAGKQAHVDMEEEEKRLLYVGVTRARDTLILTTENDQRMKTGGWLCLTNCDWLLPDSSSLMLPDKTTIQTDCQQYAMIELEVNKIKYNPQWFEKYPECTDKLNESLNPSFAAPEHTATANVLLNIGKRITIAGSPDMAKLGNAIHAVIAAKCINNHYQKEDAKKLLKNLNMEHHICVDDIFKSTQYLMVYINSHYPNAQLHVEYPVQQILNTGQVIRGWIDLLIETELGWVICDHKTSPKKMYQLKDEALSHSGQLKMYADAVIASSDKPVLITMIHFPVSSCIVVVKI